MWIKHTTIWYRFYQLEARNTIMVLKKQNSQVDTLSNSIGMFRGCLFASDQSPPVNPSPWSIPSAGERRHGRWHQTRSLTCGNDQNKRAGGGGDGGQYCFDYKASLCPLCRSDLQTVPPVPRSSKQLAPHGYHDIRRAWIRSKVYCTVRSSESQLILSD